MVRIAKNRKNHKATKGKKVCYRDISENKTGIYGRRSFVGCLFTLDSEFRGVSFYVGSGFRGVSFYIGFAVSWGAFLRWIQNFVGCLFTLDSSFVGCLFTLDF